MEERRKNRRIALESTLLIKRMDGDGHRQVDVEVTNASKTGLGFMCPEQLEIGAVYESYLTIWTKEVLHAFLEIVRMVDKEDGTFEYGSIFIGMSEMDASRIATYDTIDNMNE